jgi:spore coat protein A, manganese oxidase
MTNKRISRKKFLGMSAAAGAGLMLASGIPAALAQRRTSFAPYKVPLPVPPKAQAGAGGVYRISAEQFTQSLHPKLPAVKVWGYNDGATQLYPGPTIEVDKNASTTVEFTNNLPNTHLLPVDPVVAGERGTNSRILTHLHGGFVSGADDGNPHATQDEFDSNETQTVTYPPQPRATTLWYHDHGLGVTRLNVYAGLAGYFLVRDENDSGAEPNPIGIPGGDYEIPIVIQDKSFRGGQLFYSQTATWIPEFFGETIVINGAVQPFLTVEPRMYRFRFLNGSQSRFYHLELAGGPRFNQIGSEGGMFDAPVAVRSILLLPAERADVIVDFSGFDGQDLILKNRKLPAGVVSPATLNLPNLMQFRVRGPVTTPGPQTIPATLAGGSKPNLGDPAKTRYITLEEVLDAAGNPIQLQINGRVFHDAVDEDPAADSIEDWSFVNISADTHPIHMHLTQFQVMGRTPLDAVAYADALAAARAEPGVGQLLPNNTIDPTPFLLGPEVPPAPNERGWKDTVGAHPNEVTRIRQKFELPEGVSAPQKYVYHCHILEHEDNDMMRPYDVVE